MIRKAEKSDRDSIQKLIKELTGEDITDSVLDRLQIIYSSSLDSLFVYEYEKEIVGAIGFKIRENMERQSCYGEISIIVVSEKFQKKGLGKQLIDYAEDIAIKNNCSGTWVVSGFGKKEKAHEFYKSLGYIPTGFKYIKHTK